MTKKHSPTQLYGLKAEIMACNFLQKHGLKKVTSNYTTYFGEIDLIMADEKTLVFVEVRHRQYHGIVSSAESVDRKKQKKIIRSAIAYLQKNPSPKNCRFDVIAISSMLEGNEINWIKDAFQVQ